MDDKFKVSVVLAIFIKSADDSTMPLKCAFYDKNGWIYLPSAPVTANQYAHQVAIDLVKKMIPIDPQLLHIIPIGFFDPIKSEDTDRANRTIMLGYRVIIAPGMPVLTELEFKDNEELGIAAERLSKDHFRIYRAGLYA